MNDSQHRIVHLKPGTYIKTTVRDTGSGIPSAIIDKIFDPFFTTKEKGRGTGLGLASAYGIIKNHGGVIQAHSEVNRGATFEIFLPASDRASVEKIDPDGLIRRGGETVLLVDDEISILEICGEMLKRLGYQVITAATGEEALAIFETEKDNIDLVVLDLIMPGMGGEEVYKRLADKNPDIRVLLASGYALERKTGELLSLGAAGFIQKPYSVTSLSQKVREALA